MIRPALHAAGQPLTLLDHLVAFSRCLREAGIPVAPSSVMDLCRAVDHLDIARQDAPEGSTLWIHDDEHGDVEALIRFVLRLAEELDLTGLWGFQYSLTCSRPRLDAFGGGAHVIDLGSRKSIGWTSSQEWLAAALNGEDVDA